MKGSTSRRASGAGGCPTVRAGIIFPAGVKIDGLLLFLSAPYDHFSAGPNCCVDVARSGALVVLVAVQVSVLGLYLPPVLKTPLLPRPPQTIISPPVQTAVWRRALGRVGGAGGGPTVSAGIISAASVK